MSFIDNLKGTLKSLIGSKTDKVVEESKVKMEEAPTPTVEVMQQPVEEVVESTPEVMMDNAVGEMDMPAAPAIDTTVDSGMHTENQ